jgi:ABC-type Fe3+-citrate transport system substrate-binding protein
MVRMTKKSSFFLLFLLIIIVSACASSGKNTYYKKKKSSHVHTEQLGRNKYFFSPSYQKKLSTSYKKKK